jgi:hypothetical protein
MPERHSGGDMHQELTLKLYSMIVMEARKASWMLMIFTSKLARSEFEFHLTKLKFCFKALKVPRMTSMA